MRKVLSIAIYATFVLLVPFVPSVIAAESRTFRVGTTSTPDTSNMMVHLGVKLGFYKKRGVDVELRKTSMGDVRQALLGGGIDATTFAAPVIRLAYEGVLGGRKKACVVALAVIHNRFPARLAVQKKIKSIKGVKIFALSKAYRQHHAVFRQKRGRKYGEPDDFKYIEPGYTGPRLAAVARADADAGLIYPPYTIVVNAGDIPGVKILDVDLPVMMADGLYGMCEQVKRNSGLFRDVVLATRETIRFVRDQKNRNTVLAQIERIIEPYVGQMIKKLKKSGLKEHSRDKILSMMSMETLNILLSSGTEDGKATPALVRSGFRITLAWEDPLKVEGVLRRLPDLGFYYKP